MWLSELFDLVVISKVSQVHLLLPTVLFFSKQIAICLCNEIECRFRKTFLELTRPISCLSSLNNEFASYQTITHLGCQNH